MGNSALRRELRQTLGRRFCRKGARDKYRAYELRILLQELQVKVGDVYFDCDGVNHRVGSVTPFYVEGDLVDVQVMSDRGRHRCHCADFNRTFYGRQYGLRAVSPIMDEPLPISEIVRTMTWWVKTEWVADSPRALEVKRRMSLGIPFLDEQGVLLKEIP